MSESGGKWKEESEEVGESRGERGEGLVMQRPAPKPRPPPTPPTPGPPGPQPRPQPQPSPSPAPAQPQTSPRPAPKPQWHKPTQSFTRSEVGSTHDGPGAGACSPRDQYCPPPPPLLRFLRPPPPSLPASLPPHPLPAPSPPSRANGKASKRPIPKIPKNHPQKKALSRKDPSKRTPAQNAASKKRTRKSPNQPSTSRKNFWFKVASIQENRTGTKSNSPTAAMTKTTKASDEAKPRDDLSITAPRQAWVVDETSAREILQGKRSWELRDKKLRKRGRFCIAARRKGMIYGEVDFVDTIAVGKKIGDTWHPYDQGPEAKNNFFMNPKNVTKHNNMAFNRNCQTLHAWVLQNPQTYNEPVRYRPIKGPKWQPLSEKTRVAAMQQREPPSTSSPNTTDNLTAPCHECKEEKHLEAFSHNQWRQIQARKPAKCITCQSFKSKKKRNKNRRSLRLQADKKTYTCQDCDTRKTEDAFHRPQLHETLSDDERRCMQCIEANTGPLTCASCTRTMDLDQFSNCMRSFPTQAISCRDCQTKFEQQYTRSGAKISKNIFQCRSCKEFFLQMALNCNPANKDVKQCMNCGTKRRRRPAQHKQDKKRRHIDPFSPFHQ